MKTHLIIISLIVLGAFAFAQGSEEARQARQDLESTDLLIERAEPVIREADNPEALRLLSEAKDLQREAWGHFNQRRYRQSRFSSQQARLRVQRGLELVEVDPRQVAEEIRRTAELLSEVEPVVRRSGVREAERLLNLALNEQETARRYFDARRYALALRFTRAARQHGREALGMVRRRGGREQVEQELERTDQLLVRARERAGKSTEDRARDILARAEALQQQAREAFRAERLPQALRLTLAARNLLLRAWEGARGETDPELAEAAAADNDRLISEWRSTVDREGDEPTRRMFRGAVERQERVRVRLAAREYGPAYREANQVRRMLNRAIGNLHAESATESDN